MTHIWNNKPLRFILVGLIVTAIDLGATWLAVNLTGTRAIAVTLGFSCGLLASYLLHAKITFTANLAPITQIPRFLTLVSLNYLLTIGIVLFSTELLNLPTMMGKILSLPVVAVSSYLISKHWIYQLGPMKSSG